MAKGRRRLIVGTFAAAALVISASALAWACTPAAHGAVNPSFGLPGALVNFVGGSFVSGGAVEIRWGAASGPVVATATGASFSVQVPVPSDAAPGPTYLVAVGYSTDGSRAGMARVPFRVSPVPAPKVSEPEVSLGAGEGAATAAPAVAEPQTFVAPPAAARGNAERASVSVLGNAATPPANAPPTKSAAPPGGQAVAPAQGTPPDPAMPGATADRSVSGDLWSGFAASPSSARGLFADGQPSESGDFLFLAAGGLVAVGLLALAALGVAHVHRRQPAHASPPEG